mmetsp:Transcript_10428/g.28485  ORF Transcript_10428/g.28485 Transcript_10428/m.28485 type:complete len:274 (-) Transcript_10428:42-863(-)
MLCARQSTCHAAPSGKGNGITKAIGKIRKNQLHRAWHFGASSANYDHPALYTAEDTFSESSYWDNRFKEDPTPFEWYQRYHTIRPLLLHYLPRSEPILQVGMGTSLLQLDMVGQDGFECIVNVDYSKEAVRQQQEAHKHIPQLVYMEGDVRRLTANALLQPSSFVGVLDKGTMDALLCGERDTEDSEEMLAEVYKVLQPGGVYLQLTHAEPCSRLRYLMQRPQSPWACVEVWEVGHTGTSHGPYPIKEGLDPDILPTKRELFSHWFYACKKAG